MAGETSRTYQFVFDLITKGKFASFNDGIKQVEEFVDSNKHLKESFQDVASVAQVGMDSLFGAFDRMTESLNEGGQGLDKLVSKTSTVGDRISGLSKIVTSQFVGGWNVAAVGLDTVYNLLSINLVRGFAVAAVSAMAFAKVVKEVSNFLVIAGESASEQVGNLSQLQQAYNSAGKQLITFTSQYELAANNISRGRLGESFTSTVKFFDALGAASLSLSNKIFDVAASMAKTVKDTLNLDYVIDGATKRLKDFAAYFNKGIIGEDLLDTSIQSFLRLDTTISNVEKTIREISELTNTNTAENIKYFNDLSNTLGSQEKSLATINMAFKASAREGYASFKELLAITSNWQRGLMATEEQTRKLGFAFNDYGKGVDTVQKQMERFINTRMPGFTDADKKRLQEIIGTSDAVISSMREELEYQKMFGNLSVEEESKRLAAIAKQRSISADINNKNAAESIAAAKNAAATESALRINAYAAQSRARALFFGVSIKEEYELGQVQANVLKKRAMLEAQSSDERKRLLTEAKNAEIANTQEFLNANKNLFDQLVESRKSSMDQLQNLGMASPGMTNSLTGVAQERVKLLEKSIEASHRYYQGAEGDSRKQLSFLQSENAARSEQVNILSATREKLFQMSQESGNLLATYAKMQGSGTFEALQDETRLHNQRIARIKELMDLQGNSEERMQNLRKQLFQEELSQREKVKTLYIQTGDAVVQTLAKNEISLRKQQIAQDNIFSMIKKGQFDITQRDPYRTYQLQQGGATGAVGLLTKLEAATQLQSRGFESLLKPLRDLARAGDLEGSKRALTTILDKATPQVRAVLDDTGMIENALQPLVEKIGMKQSDPLNTAAVKLEELAKAIDNDRKKQEENAEVLRKREEELRALLRDNAQKLNDLMTKELPTLFEDEKNAKEALKATLKELDDLLQASFKDNFNISSDIRELKKSLDSLFGAKENNIEEAKFQQGLPPVPEATTKIGELLSGVDLTDLANKMKKMVENGSALPDMAQELQNDYLRKMLDVKEALKKTYTSVTSLTNEDVQKASTVYDQAFIEAIQKKITEMEKENASKLSETVKALKSAGTPYEDMQSSIEAAKQGIDIGVNNLKEVLESFKQSKGLIPTPAGDSANPDEFSRRLNIKPILDTITQGLWDAAREGQRNNPLPQYGQSAITTNPPAQEQKTPAEVLKSVFSGALKDAGGDLSTLVKDINTTLKDLAKRPVVAQISIDEVDGSMAKRFQAGHLNKPSTYKE